MLESKKASTLGRERRMEREDDGGGVGCCCVDGYGVFVFVFLCFGGSAD